jgi:sirohydrochlorin cobaltochelatase
MQPKAIILFAHGSRDPAWRAPMEAVAKRIRAQQPSLAVECAYLELCEPDLPTCAIKIIAAHAHFYSSNGPLDKKSIRIIPMFLGMGKHAREDLPQLLTQLRTTHPLETFELAPTVGEDPRVIALLADLALADFTS